MTTSHSALLNVLRVSILGDRVVSSEALEEREGRREIVSRFTLSICPLCIPRTHLICVVDFKLISAVTAPRRG